MCLCLSQFIGVILHRSCLPIGTIVWGLIMLTIMFRKSVIFKKLCQYLLIIILYSQLIFTSTEALKAIVLHTVYFTKTKICSIILVFHTTSIVATGIVFVVFFSFFKNSLKWTSWLLLTNPLNFVNTIGCNNIEVDQLI